MSSVMKAGKVPRFRATVCVETISFRWCLSSGGSHQADTEERDDFIRDSERGRRINVGYPFRDPEIGASSDKRDSFIILGSPAAVGQAFLCKCFGLAQNPAQTLLRAFLQRG